MSLLNFQKEAMQPQVKTNAATTRLNINELFFFAANRGEIAIKIMGKPFKNIFFKMSATKKKKKKIAIAPCLSSGCILRLKLFYCHSYSN